MSMFDNSPQNESSSQLCKPDPEDMIERANKRKSNLQRAVDLFNELDGLPVNLHSGRGSEEYILQLYGSAHAGIRACDKEIQRWKDEIDNDL